MSYQSMKLFEDTDLENGTVRVVTGPVFIQAEFLE